MADGTIDDVADLQIFVLQECRIIWNWTWWFFVGFNLIYSHVFLFGRIISKKRKYIHNKLDPENLGHIQNPSFQVKEKEEEDKERKHVVAYFTPYQAVCIVILVLPSHATHSTLRD